MEAAMSQKWRMGLWNTSGRSTGEPGHHGVMTSPRIAICRAISP
jgi:hypothetical protein